MFDVNDDDDDDGPKKCNNSVSVLGHLRIRDGREFPYTPFALAYTP